MGQEIAGPLLIRPSTCQPLPRRYLDKYLEKSSGRACTLKEPNYNLILKLGAFFSEQADSCQDSRDTWITCLTHGILSLGFPCLEDIAVLQH